MVNHFKSTEDAQLEMQLQRTVLFKAATAKFKDVTIDQSKYSGLSIYIPLDKWKTHNEYRYYFESLEWSRLYGE